MFRNCLGIGLKEHKTNEGIRKQAKVQPPANTEHTEKEDIRVVWTYLPWRREGIYERLLSDK